MKKIDRLAYKYGVSFIKHGKKALAVLLFSAVALLIIALFVFKKGGSAQEENRWNM